MENPPKRKETDLISNLPDHLILKILSLVPIKNVITTTPTLSKRWQHLWTCLPRFRFTLDNKSLPYSPQISPFLTFINHVLLHSTSPTIHKLFIQLPYSPTLHPHFTHFVQWALARNVKKLLLDFQPPVRIPHNYVPQPFFQLGLDLCTESSLKTLFVSKCMFPETGGFSFRFLTRLTMCHVVLDDGVLERLLAGSPVLERLELISFYGFSNLCIMNKNLKRLMLLEYWAPRGGSGGNNVLTITAPYIWELVITNCMCDLQLRLADVSSLVSAKIDFDYWRNEFESDRWLKVGKGMLLSLAHVKELMLGKWLLQVLSVLWTQSFSYSLSNCKSLTLNSHMSNFGVPSVISLLNSSPQLETLIIRLGTFTDFFNSGGLAPTYHDSEKFLNSLDQIIKCLALHLKTVKIGTPLYCCMKWEITKQWKNRNSDPTLPSNKYDLEYLLSEEELHNNGEVDHQRLLLAKLVSCKETFRMLIFEQDMCCQLLEYLLMNGKFLEKLVITSQREVCHLCSTCCAFEYLSLVAEKLSTVPRSSAGAVIKFVEKQP